MRVTIICHFFLPEPGAPPARVSSLAREWTRLGHQVTVLTGFPNHPTGQVPPEYRGQRLRIEYHDGYRVVRTWIYPAASEAFWKKNLNHLSFAASALLIGAPRLGASDIIVVSSPTLLSAGAAQILASVTRVPLVLDIRDLWPAAVEALGVVRKAWVLTPFRRLESFLYHRASKIVVVTDGFRAELLRRGISADKIEVIPNGVDIAQLGPRARPYQLAESLGIPDRFIVAYVGTVGRAQGLKIALQAARLLLADPRVFFLIVGDGAEREPLRAEADGLSNLRVLPGVPREQVLDMYDLADVLLVTMRDVALFRSFIPSKVFEYLAAGRPIVAAVAGETADIVERSGAGLVVPPDDAAALVKALRQLIEDQDLRERLASKGPRFVAQHYDRRRLAERYEGVLRAVVAGLGSQK